MSKAFLPIAGLAALGSMGCLAPQPMPRPDRVAISGFVVKTTKPTTNPNDNPYGFVDISKIDVGNVLGSLRLEDILDPFVDKGGAIRTPYPIKFDILDNDGSQDRQEFLAYGGPTPGTKETAELGLKAGSFTIYTGMGWVYVYGLNPHAGTDWGTGGARGSKMLVQIDGDIHRFYFISGTSAWVDPIALPLFEWDEKPSYVEITDEGRTLSAVKPMDGTEPPEITSFFNEVMDIVAAGGP